MEQKQINEETLDERILKLSGAVTLPEEILRNHDYAIGLIINVPSITKKSNHNGTYDEIYRAEPVGGIVINKDFGQKIFATSRKSWSKRWRAFVELTANEDYDLLMGKMLSHGEEVINFVKKL